MLISSKRFYSKNKSKLGWLIILAGLQSCSTTSNFNAEYYQDKIDKENEKLAQHKQQIAEIEKQIRPKQRVQSYIKSAEGKKFYKAGACRTPPKAVIPLIPRPAGSCNNDSDIYRYIGGECEVDDKCELVGAMVALDRLPKSLGYLTNLGCEYNKNEDDFASNAVDVISDTFCDIGVNKKKDKKKGKKNKKNGGRGKGKLGFVLGLARGAACYNKVEKFRKRVDRFSMCIETKAAECRATYANWVTQSDYREQQLIANASATAEGMDRCEAATKTFKLSSASSERQLDEEISDLKSERDRLEEKIVNTRKKIESIEKRNIESRDRAAAKETKKSETENKIRDF